MFSIRQLIGVCVLAAAMTLAVQQIEAQDRDRGPAPVMVRGVVKSVDGGANAITVTTFQGREQPAGEKTYTLAKDAEVGVGLNDRRAFGLLKECKLTDLTPGVTVTLALTADQKSVDAVIAEGPQVRGTLKSIDAEKKTLTLSLAVRRGEGRGEPETEEKTYSVASNAEIGVDDGRARRFSLKEAKLTDLAQGSFVTVWLSVDQKQAQSIMAEGPSIFGMVKAIDAGKNTITLTTNAGRGGEAEEKTLEVAKDTITLLDDGKGRRFSLKEGKLSDIPVGAGVQAKLSADQKLVTMLRAEGPSVPAQLKAVDGAKGTITIATRVARGDTPEEKTLNVAKDARILMEGKVTKLTDLKVEDNGPFVMLRLSLDQKTVQAIVAANNWIVC